MLFIKEQETTLNLRETIFRVKQGEDNHSYDVGNRPQGQSRPSGIPTDSLSLGYLQGSTARPTQHIHTLGWLNQRYIHAGWVGGRKLGGNPTDNTLTVFTRFSPRILTNVKKCEEKSPTIGVTPADF